MVVKAGIEHEGQADEKKEGTEAFSNTSRSFGGGKETDLLDRIRLNCIPYFLSNRAEELLVYGCNVEARSP